MYLTSPPNPRLFSDEVTCPNNTTSGGGRHSRNAVPICVRLRALAKPEAPGVSLFAAILPMTGHHSPNSFASSNLAAGRPAGETDSDASCVVLCV
jgi:hypothetical protein